MHQDDASIYNLEERLHLPLLHRPWCGLPNRWRIIKIEEGDCIRLRHPTCLAETVKGAMDVVTTRQHPQWTSAVSSQATSMTVGWTVKEVRHLSSAEVGMATREGIWILVREVSVGDRGQAARRRGMGIMRKIHYRVKNFPSQGVV